MALSGNHMPDQSGNYNFESEHDSTDITDMTQDMQMVIEPPSHKRRIWPWIVGGAVALVAAAGVGTYAFYQNHALPGTTLWGNDVAGKSHQQIVDQINETVDATNVPVTYNGKTTTVNLHDLGINVDAQSIANTVMDNKRNAPIFEKYNFFEKQDVAPQISEDASATQLNKKLGIEVVDPVNASIKIAEDGNTVDIVPEQQGKGGDPKPVVKQAIASVKSLGKQAPQDVEVQLNSIEPVVTNTVAQQAKDTIDKLAKNPITIKVADHEIAKIGAPALVAAARIDTNTGDTKDGEVREGNVVFNAQQLQDYYMKHIKPALQSTREDREVVVNNDGKVLNVIKEGHDGVKVANNADNNVGTDAVALITQGKGSVDIKGEVDPMKVKETKRHVVVDLSDGKLYAYENGKIIRTMHISAGQGNSRVTGECMNGDMCTPEGDFDVWLKYPTQDMSGTLTLSNGKVEKWDVKNVGFVNYFSKSGCAIHRIASEAPISDAQIAAMNKNLSHGCVGIGWDVAPWFYDFASMGTSVHVQA